MPAARMVQTVVHRADSVRSEQSDASQANKRVSFNRDVDVKHKGKKSSSSSSAALNSRQGLVDINGEELGSRIPAPVYAVYKEPTSLTEAELALEAERIIKQVDQISCTVSPNPVVFGTAGGGVPGGPVSAYETRSLERRPKRNNNSTPHQQQQQQQQQQQHQFQHPGETSWTRTLPGGSSTKNQLLDRNSVNVKTNAKNVVVVEKNSNIIQQQQRQKQLVVEQQQVTQNRESTTTPPKYDSGIEMEGGGGGYRGDIPGKRPNVNLIVQQLTEEARQRELMRQQYQQQQEEEEMAARNKDDPLAPRLPVLNLIEPDPQFGLTHNRNLPFSYTGGVSPTRLSPLRSSGMRFPSPPKTEPQDDDASGVDPGLKDDIVYAQVKVARKKSKSPDPFQYPSATSGGGVKLHLQPSARRASNDYYADDDDQRDDEDDQDIEARKAKARFLFGTRIEEDVARRKQEKEQEERGFRPSVRLDQRNNNNRNNSHPGTGLSYNYSSLIKGKHEPQQQSSYTTKVSVNNESSERKQQQQQRMIHQYNDDDDFVRRRLSAGGYKDRSMSPEPRIIQPTQQSVATRIRSLEMRSSPERYSDEIIQTLPQIKKAHHHQQQQQQQMASTRLIQEAERGRTSSRRFKAPAPSRPIQVQSRHESIGPPKPPIRVKKLSRERMDAATSTSPNGKKKFQKIVPWQPDAGSESSPERTTAFNNSSPPRRFTSYRYPSHQRSVSPSPERIRFYNNNNNINNNNVNNQQTMTLGRPINKKTTPTPVESTPEGKQEKMRRQRSKFLSVFLGPKTSRSSNKTANAAVQTTTTTTSTVSSRKQPAISKWEDDVDLSGIRKTPKGQQTRLTFQHQQQSPNDPSSGKYRRGSTDRTDTSESDDVHHHRFKSLKQKSQSFNNLNYRPDPERVLGEEEPRQRHDWNANNTSMVDNRRPVDINNANNNVTTVVTGGRYYHSDARPYASTNLINQIGRTTVDVGGRGSNDIIIDEGGINRPNPLDHNNPRTSTRPMMAMPPRQMRYFGDTDLESQQSVTNGHISHRPSVRYIPKVNKVAQRSVSNAAGMGAVRRGVMQRNNTGSGNGGKTQLHSVNSSESEGNGSAMQSGAGSAESQRSVYLHATTVADIPTITTIPNSAKAQQMQSARRRALSREDMSALSGSDRAGSTLRRTRQISRSYSVLAPWKPRHYRDKFEITYSNQQAPAGPAVNHHDVGKPPRAPPVVSSRRREDVILESEDSADVYRPVHITSPNTKPSVTRSSTMPKSNKLMAGWFRKKKQR